MKELDCVKVIKLLRGNRQFYGTETVKRPPQIGDVGTIVHYNEKGCIVESINAEGYSVWVADFVDEELEIYESLRLGGK